MNPRGLISVEKLDELMQWVQDSKGKVQSFLAILNLLVTIAYVITRIQLVKANEVYEKQKYKRERSKDTRNRIDDEEI